MRVGIIGAGAIGQTVGRLLATAGHDVLVSWSSSDAHLHLAVVRIGFGARAATPAAAVAHAEAVLFATRFEHVEAAAQAPGPFGDKVVIDTTNPYNPERSGLLDIGKQTAAEHVSARLPGARYVKAFNTLTAGFLAESAGRIGRPNRGRPGRHLPQRRPWRRQDDRRNPRSRRRVRTRRPRHPRRQRPAGARG